MDQHTRQGAGEQASGATGEVARLPLEGRQLLRVCPIGETGMTPELALISEGDGTDR